MADRVLLLSVGDSLASDTDIARWATAAQASAPVSSVAFDGWALSRNDVIVAERNGLLAALSSSQLPFLSTNLIQTRGVRPFHTYQLLESSGHCIALIGITSAFSSTGLYTEDPVQAAAKAVQKVSSKADVVIVLSNADPATNLAIASATPGIDVVIGGGDSMQEVSEKQETGTLIFSPGYAGRSMGVARVVFDSEGRRQNYRWDRTLYLPAQ